MFVLYLRQSQDTTGQGVAIERQRTECKAYAQAHGMTVGPEYVDNDKSASKGVRPAYQRLLTDIERGAVTGVLAWDLDRLHRQPMELETFINLADAKSIHLATVTGVADLGTDNGKMYARIKGAVGRAEVERKAERQKSANRQLAAKGDLQPKERPFGWLRTFEGSRPVFVELDPTEAPAIRAAVDELLTGRSALSIYKEWNARKLRTSKGNAWDNDKFRKMLLRERNAGLLTYNGVTVTATCAPIITPEELDQLRAVTSSRVRQTHGGRVNGFSGVPRCVCGHRMYLRKGPKATYACNNPEAMSHNCLSAKILDEAMWHALRFRVAQAAPERAVAEVLEALAATRARLVELEEQVAEITAAKEIPVRARLDLLVEVKTERDAVVREADLLASRSRLVQLLDGVAPHVPGMASIERHAEIGRRLKALPVHDLYDVAETALTVVVHPLPGPRRGRMASSEIVRRIEINGVRLGEESDPYEGL